MPITKEPYAEIERLRAENSRLRATNADLLAVCEETLDFLVSWKDAIDSEAARNWLRMAIANATSPPPVSRGESE